MIYIGRIRDIDDDLKEGRVKIEIASVTEGLTKEEMFWCYPKTQLHEGSFRTPKIDEIVFVEFLNDDLYNGLYWHFQNISEEVKQILKDSYQMTKILFYDTEANTYIFYTQTRGIVISNVESSIEVRKDKSIFLSQSGGGVIHLKDGNISIGTENKSKESAVLGETNEKTLNEIVSTFESIQNTMKTNLKALSEGSKSNPHTMHLVPLFEKFSIEIDTKLKTDISKIKELIPETKSKIVTLD